MRRRTALLACGVGAMALAFSGSVFSAGSGGRVDLQTLTREYDSRSTGNQQPITARTIGSGVFSVWAFNAPTAGEAVIYPCGEPVPTDEATFVFEANTIQYARFATAVDVCFSSTVPTHVIIDRQGTVTATPEIDRLQFVALATPVNLWNASTTQDKQVVEIQRPVQLSGAAGAAVISLDVPSPTNPGYLTAYGCDRVKPNAADVHYGQLTRKANVAYVELDPGENICVYAHAPAEIRINLLGELASDGPNPAALPPSWRYVPSEVPAPSLKSIVPERVLDTRFGVGRVGTAKVEPKEVVEIDFGSLVGPQTTAVVLNVTVDQPESTGFVTAWPCGGDQPVVSNLNFVAGEAVPNLVVSKLGPSRTVCLSGIARTHLVADLNGTFESDGGLRAQPIDPVRILDTRKALGTPTTTKLLAGQTLELQITGANVPAVAGAATVNVTVTEPNAPGFITAYPCDKTQPTASNLNYVAGQTVANLVTAKLSGDGKLCLFTRRDTHLIADLAAWYGPDQPAGLVDLNPKRFLDTRKAVGIPTTTKVAAGKFIKLKVAGQGQVPADADAVVMNVTATEPEGNGFVTAWPCDQSMPVVSNVNYVAGETNPNLATVKLAADGTVCLFTKATSHLLADVSGYLTDQNIVTQALTLQPTTP